MKPLRPRTIYGGAILLGVFFAARSANAFSRALQLVAKNHAMKSGRETHTHVHHGIGRRHPKPVTRTKNDAPRTVSALVVDPFSSTETLSVLGDSLRNMGRDQAEQLAGPFFGASLFPYLAFLWLLARDENECPKGVTVGFATCLLFVFLTIPAAIAAQVLYGVSLADSDWLHGSAESLLTVTNLVTVVAFRQALESKEKDVAMPSSATSWSPMVWLVVALTALVSVTALVPAVSDPLVHTRYLGGFMDLPNGFFDSLGANPEPENALSITTWIIHVSSLVEFLVAMGFAWRWATVVDNPTWKGLTWGLLPLHSSGITACTYHIFYNRIPILVPLQAFLTCVGNTTAALATYRIARSNGWKPEGINEQWILFADSLTNAPTTEDGDASSVSAEGEAETLVGFEDLGDALAGDNDYSFLIKLFAGCAVASYVIKYGEIYFDFFYEADLWAGLAFIFIPSGLNAYKWYRRGQDPSFEGWF
ncbi:unnamed protein product [Pseudo-nitzschia multistriata]|uniref:Uncharacterized protein n=1 Tax=Pseudo-nitzschia multistriata TaxID=183589 RepID=A0A448YX50_9STRA|nr:unnamed protein product [Pseudo-nitzschia multistriata]